MRHAGVRTGNDDGIKGKTLAAVFIEAVDQLGTQLFFRHALMNTGADLGKGLVRDLLRLDHAVKLPLLLAGAEGVQLLLHGREIGTQRFFVAVEFTGRDIIFLIAEILNAEIPNGFVQADDIAAARCDVDDLEIFDIVLSRLDIAAVGKIARAGLADDGNALSNVKLGSVHAVIARGQQ